ncbi:zinc finger transcription factor YY1 [Solanum verrucosum]|uniref:zinc finger transcription factor YY1 n=1 Tax=Solanum verrucosum TaxID=315347 RepID=UPI0020D1CDA5|nr:zinc finger transcription factor YY1 [Solanum verrucosum]
MQAFSLDFNLRSHMKTHSQENYHICPYPECGKRYAHEYKLKNHISSTHQKNNTPDAHAHTHAPKYTPPVEKPVKTPKSSSAAYGSSSSDRPYSCPYEGCDKSYIHEYKLNLHLRNMHPGHFPEENARNVQSTADNEMDEGSDQDAYAARRGNGRIQKQSRPKPSLKQPPLKVARKSSSSAAQVNLSISKKPWPIKEENFNEEDSEETEEERDDVGDGWRYGENDDDDEETEEDD